MKIAIISDEHFPHTGADTEVIVNTAAALGDRGAQVTLIVPWLPGKRERLDDICSFYGVNPSFRLAPIFGWPFPSRKLRLEKMFHGLLGDLHPAVRGADVVHSRDVLPLMIARVGGIPWSFETYRRHVEEKPWLPPVARALGVGSGVGAVAHSDASRLDLIRMGFSEDAVITARPGFATERFAAPMSREEARRKAGLPEHGPMVAYVGNITPSKGLDQLLEVARRLPDVTFLVVGGNEQEVRELQTQVGGLGLRNVTLLGHRRPSEVAPYLFAADALFAPGIWANVHSGWLAKAFPSTVLPGVPLKLYAYLASGRPIVGADLAIYRDLLCHGDNALLFPPGSMDVAAESIRRLVSDRGLGERLANRGLELVKTHTWDARAQAMLSFFERRLAAGAPA